MILPEPNKNNKT